MGALTHAVPDHASTLSLDEIEEAGVVRRGGRFVYFCRACGGLFRAHDQLGDGERFCRAHLGGARVSAWDAAL